MTNNPTPTSLNWVAKRAACNVAFVFKELEDGVRSDVEEMTKKFPDMADALKMNSRSDFFSVVRIFEPMSQFVQSVNFKLSKDGITATDFKNDEPREWLAGITLNNEGRCLLRVEGKELEQWQFRRMVLERLLFGPLC